MDLKCCGNCDHYFIDEKPSCIESYCARLKKPLLSQPWQRCEHWHFDGVDAKSRKIVLKK